MNTFATIAKTRAIHAVLTCAVFCAATLCPAQETARGIVAEKIGTTKNSAERPDPEIYFTHGQIDVRRIAWSPNEKYIIFSNSNYSTSAIWNITAGKEIYSFDQKIPRWIPNTDNFILDKEIWNISTRTKETILDKWKNIEPCGVTGKYVLNYTDYYFDLEAIYDIKTEEKYITIPNNRFCFFDSDTKCVTVSESEIEIWNVENKEKIKSYPYKTNDYRGFLYPCSVSPNGDYLAVHNGHYINGETSDDKIDIFDLRNGHKLFEYLANTTVKYLTWSPNSKYLLIYGGEIDHSAREPMTIYNIDTQKIIRLDDFHEEGVTWSFDSNYFTAGGTIVDVTNGSFNKELSDDAKNVSASAFSPTGTFLANVYWDGSMDIWNYKTKKKVKSISSKFNAIGIKKILGITENEIYIQYNGKDDNHPIAQWNITTGTLDTCRNSHFYEYDYEYNPTVSHYGKYDASKKWGYDTVRIKNLCDEEEYIDTGCANEISMITWNHDDNCLAMATKENIYLFDINTKKLKQATLPHPFLGISFYDSKIEFSPSDKYVAFLYLVEKSTSDREKHCLALYNTNDLSLISDECYIGSNDAFSWSPDEKFIAVNERNMLSIFDVEQKKIVKKVPNTDYVTQIIWSYDGKHILTHTFDGITIWDAITFEKKQTLNIDCTFKDVCLTHDSKHIITTTDNTVKIWNLITGNLEASMLLCSNGEWLTYTPEGFFCGSEWATQNLVYIVDGMDVIGIDQVYDTYYRPDLVAAKMRGEDISAYASSIQLASLVRSGRAPMVSLSDIPAESSGRDMTFGISVRNTGGGIGAVNLLLNGKAIRLSDGIASADGETVTFRHTVTLQNGSNTLEAFALNGAGLVESLRSSAEVVWRGATEKPDLYVLTAAVNRYRDKSLWLNYAVPDADAVAQGFQKQKSGLYRNVHISQLSDSDVTKEKLATEFSRLSEHIRADDVFVFFVSGHGTTYDDGDYYYLPSDFRYTSKDSIPGGGISKNDLLTNLSKIKAGKTLVMLDTCNSGAFLSDFGQRGLSEKTAIDRLTRATGHATLAASSDTQSAMEGYNGHGVFTYVFLEGIAGAADSDGDGYVTLNELSAFVEREVPQRSFEKWGYEQVPQKDLRRQDFPIAGK